MAQKLIISVSGLRGIVGENLNFEIARDYARAFGSFLVKQNNQNKQKINVCIARDSRPSGKEFVEALTEGLISTGINVIKLGLTPTPTVGIMTTNLSCNGGIVVTASHNPSEYNGIKLLLKNGMAPPPEKAEIIKALFFEKSFTLAQKEKYGTVSEEQTAYQTHIKKILQIIDENKIADKKFKVVLDSVNGAGGPITEKLLTRLGCNVVSLNTEPTGLFSHTPEPRRENLTELCRKVKEENADVGFAQDPDADRLAVVDENGNYIGEEYTLALAAKFVLSKNPGPVAANLSTSRMIEHIAKEAGVEVIRTPVGEANVAKAMLENNCVIGGEGNGGVIDLRISPIRDSLLAASLILQLVAESGKSIAQLVAQIPRYYMQKHKFNADTDTVRKVLKEAQNTFKNAKVNDADGLRFDFPDAWLHLRPSNTEPVLRAIVEAENKTTPDEYLRIVENIRKKIAMSENA